VSPPCRATLSVWQPDRRGARKHPPKWAVRCWRDNF
jgi:hypothetical protein